MLEDRQQGSHIFQRVMSLQVGSLDGNHAVVGSVRFVEPVSSEIFPFIKDVAGCALVDVILHRPRDKFLAVALELLLLLLGNRLT